MNDKNLNDDVLNSDSQAKEDIAALEKAEIPSLVSEKTAVKDISTEEKTNTPDAEEIIESDVNEGEKENEDSSLFDAEEKTADIEDTVTEETVILEEDESASDSSLADDSTDDTATDKTDEHSDSLIFTEEKFLSPDNIFAKSEDTESGNENLPTEASDENREDTTAVNREAQPERKNEEEMSAEDPEKAEVVQYTILNLPTVPTDKKDSDTVTKPGTYNPEKPRTIDKIFDFIELFVFTLVAVMLISTFFFRHAVVDGPSMEQTLYQGDHLIISNFFYTPKQNDIIVCDDHSLSIKELRKPIVKRVIATAGQRVTITSDGVVKVDGKEIDEKDYVFIDDKYFEYAPYDDVVPEGKIFVMGDHRNASSDSRLIGVGPIDEDAVIGKVIFRISPNFGVVD